MSIPIARIEDLKPDPRNANRGTPRGHGIIEGSIRRHGAGRSGLAANDGTMIAGSQTLEEMAALGIKIKPVHTTGDEWVVVIRDDVAPGSEQATLMAIEDNRASELGLVWEPGVLAELAGDVDLSALFTADELAELAQPADEVALLAAEDDTAEPEIEAPDLLFPSDNSWGIPTLDLKLQAKALAVPCERWGRNSRHSAQMAGTWHFYTEDYKFNALWSDPTPIVFSGARALIEPNVSTNVTMPAAVALWGIYRKRWIARWAQSYGVQVFVDLNVDTQFTELNLLGVPRGWLSYATRGYDTMIELLDYDYKTACKHAETDAVVFVVVGGGQATHAHCMERGWVHVPQENHVVEEREYING